MFFKKKPEVIQPKEILEVKCHVCRHKIEETDAQKIQWFKYEHSTSLFLTYSVYVDYDRYFCPMHKVEYDFAREKEGKISYFKNIPAREQEVSEDGKIKAAPNQEKSK